VVVHWDGEGTRLDGKPYENTYAWFMRFRDGLVVEATAFYDSITFNELWDEVTPKNYSELPGTPDTVEVRRTRIR
jgi:uncharacterized protein